jgi:hypothetical protein
VSVFLLSLLASAASAASWCAAPLVVHEWGVHVVRVDGAAPAGVPLPSWFHDQGDAGPSGAVPVRALPADSGIRALPVVQLYVAPWFGDEAPVALEVGFRDGAASSWWPAVDRRVPAGVAGSVASARQREQLLAERAARVPSGRAPTPGPDPTKQLGWDRLELTGSATAPLRPPEQDWVAALRRVPGAAWVSREGESDRFVYYEATTREAPDVALRRTGSWWSGVTTTLVNRSDYPLHDVIVLVDGRAWTAPALPPGRTAEVTPDRPLDRDALVAWLRARWTDRAGPPTSEGWDLHDCVMMRDPAIPVERTTGHRLYEAELDVLFDVWADRLLAGDAPRVLYREDPDAIDARMPLAVYTDMYHDVSLHRLGITAVEGWRW